MATQPAQLVTPPGLPTGSAAAVTWAVKAALVLIPIVLTIWQPNGAFNSATAQIWVVTAGIFAAAAIHLGELAFEALKQYGFTKASLFKIETEGSEWVRANWTDIKDAYENARGLGDAKDILPKLAAYHNEVVDVRGKLANQPVPVDHAEAIAALHARIDALPVASKEDLINIVDDEFKSIIGHMAGINKQ